MNFFSSFQTNFRSMVHLSISLHNIGLILRCGPVPRSAVTVILEGEGEFARRPAGRDLFSRWLEIVSIDLGIVGPLIRQIFERENSCHRAHWNARSTVNAFLWVYVELR